MEQVIKVGDIWFDKSGENPVIVLVHDKERRSVSFTYLLTINGELDLTESISSVDLFLKTKELMVTSSAENKQYIKGKTAGYNEGYEEATAESQYDYDKGYEDGKSFGVNLGKDYTVFQKQWVDKEKKSYYERGYHDGYKVCDEEKGNSFNSGYNQGCNDASEGFELRKSVLNKEYVKGKTEGYNEGYQHGFTLAKENTKDLDDNELEGIIDDAFQEGYAQAYSELHAPTTERERQLQEKAWDEGYKSAIEDCLTQGDEFVSNKGCYEFRYEVGAEQFIKENMDNIKSYTRVGEVVSIELYDNDCEHTPNKETQEAMQEVLDKYSNEFVGIWVAKDGSGKLKVLSVDEGDCDVELVENVSNSYLCVGDTATISVDDLKEHWNKERAECNYITTEDAQLEKELALVEKYPHYYKDIHHLNIIDIYRFFDLFEVTDPCIQHSLKKLAVGGKRGAKDYEKDIKEAMDTLKRWEYMQEENKRGMND